MNSANESGQFCHHSVMAGKPQTTVETSKRNLSCIDSHNGTISKHCNGLNVDNGKYCNCVYSPYWTIVVRAVARFTNSAIRTKPLWHFFSPADWATAVFTSTDYSCSYIQYFVLPYLQMLWQKSTVVEMTRNPHMPHKWQTSRPEMNKWKSEWWWRQAHLIKKYWLPIRELLHRRQ